ncbi:MAG: hypothetical protein BKP49_00970 [Treponema sp. CETP13]|nr:MAG: hypothetical protein BKP49_00970 [Treponema sp. CETP13]
MKKTILMVVMICASIALTFSQANATDSSSAKANSTVKVSKEIPADKASNMTYQNATILKIYDAPHSYLVMYQSGEWDISKVAFPKEWFSQFDDRGRIRSLPAKFGSFMTVFYKDGKFAFVKLSVPPNRDDDIWGVWKQDNLDAYLADENFIMQY